MWQLTVLPFSALFALLSAWNSWKAFFFFLSSLRILKGCDNIIHSFNIYWITCKAWVYKTDKVSTYMGLTLWSRRTTINQEINTQANFRLACGMKQGGRIQRESPGSEGYLFKMARESLSEEVTVKLRWGKNMLERGIDKVHIKAPRQGRAGESEVQGKGQCGWVSWPWGGEEGCSQRGGRGDTSHKTLRVLPHYPPTPPKNFFKSAKEDEDSFLCIWRWVLLPSLDWWSCGFTPLFPSPAGLGNPLCAGPWGPW